MLSKADIKKIKALQIRKFRNKYKEFLAGGDKIVKQILQTPHQFEVIAIYATGEWISATGIPEKYSRLVIEINEAELKQISHQKTPNNAIAMMRIPEREFSISALNGKLSLALDGIRDPGNLGTMLRIAEWFGIDQIICSEDCVELFNPKVIQSSMGAFLTVDVQYTSLNTFIHDYKDELKHPVYGAALDGTTLYGKDYDESGLIVIGNESMGIREEIMQAIDHRITIPSWQKEGKKSVDSLNAAIAASLICSEFRRQLPQ